jgi:hypothetical protein
VRPRLPHSLRAVRILTRDSRRRYAHRHRACFSPPAAQRGAADRRITTQLRDDWGYENVVTCDAGSFDLLINTHGVCETRECAAKIGLENGMSVEMGGGTYVFETLPGACPFLFPCYATARPKAV